MGVMVPIQSELSDGVVHVVMVYFPAVTSSD